MPSSQLHHGHSSLTATAVNSAADLVARPLLPPVPDGRDARSNWLKETAKDAALAVYCLAGMGTDVHELDAPFRCVLHDDCLATLTRGKNGEVVYRDGPQGDPRRRFQTLAELRAARGYGSPRRLGGLEIALWRLRLLHELDLVVLPRVPVPGAPERCPEFVVKVRGGFELLVRCREWLDPGSSVAFARRFIAAWCSVDPAVARDALAYLVGHGVIAKTGEASGGNLHPTYLYRPGFV